MSGMAMFHRQPHSLRLTATAQNRRDGKYNSFADMLTPADV
jgi:hypothetical protein